ncbi:MAG TPA: glycosyltransferase [Actinoplanes sp.]
MTQIYAGHARSATPAETAPEPSLIVLSHLPWTWVWQRPQHLISRLGAGRRTWFVEQPVRADVSTPTLRHADVGPVHRVWLEVPHEVTVGDSPLLPFELYGDQVAALLGDDATGSDVWLYSPMALGLAESLSPRLLAYDVMDDLSAFADGGASMAEHQQRALRRADIAFAGGRSLHRVAAAVRGPDGVHLFPSGVEVDHYATSRQLRRHRARPAAGYVGVIDERLDLRMIADLAAALPGWDIHLVGPIIKIDPASVPQAANLHYPGMQAYDELPAVMARLDVALMPFALNDATRAISPTKTLEYLAAGLPVVSSRVPDVVTDWGGVVHFADDGAGFADACLAVRDDCVAARDTRVAPLRRRHEWDAIAAEMRGLLAAAAEARTGAPA